MTFYLLIESAGPTLLGDFGGCCGTRHYGSVFGGVVKLVRIEFSGRVCARPNNGAVNGFVERPDQLTAPNACASEVLKLCSSLAPS